MISVVEFNQIGQLALQAKKGCTCNKVPLKLGGFQKNAYFVIIPSAVTIQNNGGSSIVLDGAINWGTDSYVFEITLANGSVSYFSRSPLPNGVPISDMNDAIDLMLLNKVLPKYVSSSTGGRYNGHPVLQAWPFDTTRPIVTSLARTNKYEGNGTFTAEFAKFLRNKVHFGVRCTGPK